LLYVTVRYEWTDEKSPKGYAKTYRQFHKDETTGKWIPSIDGIRRVLFGLPEHLKADPTLTRYLVEGEPKVKALRALGLVALCNPMGAGKWDDEYNPSLKGYHVVILPDNDKAGKDHAKQVAKSLKGEALSVRTVTLPRLPEKGDIIDWLKAGGTREQLEQLAPTLKLKFLYASEVKPEKVKYLWTKRLATGMLTLFVGDPGLGKGLLCARLAAEVSKEGGLLPDGKALETGGVIIMSPEDSYQHTIVPRLIAAGADLEKIILLSEVPVFDADGNQYNRPISFPEDASILEQAIKECKASLAIIDPVLAMIDGKLDSHKDQESRAALGRVLSVAERNNCALLGIFHLNKSQNANVLYRSGASIAWIAMARIGLYLVPDPDNQKNGRVLVNFKNNLSAKTTSLRFSIEEKNLEETQDNIAYVTWKGESRYTEDELLNPHSRESQESTPSPQENGIIAVLKGSEQAMTVEEIHQKLETGQTLDALTKMLQRKLGKLWIRPERGKYTYHDNPSYADTPNAPEESDDDVQMSNVQMSNSEPLPEQADAIGHDVQSTNGHKSTSEVALKQLDILDIGHLDMVKISPPVTYDGPYPPQARATFCCNSGWRWDGEQYVCGACHPLEVAV